jgi:hypothetical protein
MNNQLPPPRIIEGQRIREPTFYIPPPRKPKPAPAWIRGLGRTLWWAGVTLWWTFLVIMILIVIAGLIVLLLYHPLVVLMLLALGTAVAALALLAFGAILVWLCGREPFRRMGFFGTVWWWAIVIIANLIVIAIVLALPIKVLLGLILLALL